MSSAPPTRAIILHGMPDEPEYRSSEHPSSSNSHWLPWLQNQLQRRGYDAQTPEMFEAYAPHYPIWQAEFERHVAPAPMVLVGHSCGAGFLVRWLSEHPETDVDTLVLVAPWLDPDREYTTDFFDFTFDDNLPQRVRNFHVFISADDYAAIQTSTSMVLDHYPSAVVHKFADKGHFCVEHMGTEVFPELLEAVLA